MKKNKTLNKLIILLTLLTPTIINAKELIVCGGNKKFPTVIGTLISTVYTIIRILVPILLVISGIISFFKVTFAGNVEDSLDKAKKKLVTNIISAIVIFFIASIINFVIGLAAGKNNSFTDCMYCMLHPEECEQTDSEVATLCPGLISEQYKYNSDCTLKDEYKNGEKIDYSNTGDTKVPAYKNTIASAGGGAIARTLTNNPDAIENTKLIHKVYGENNYNYYLYIPKKIDESKSLVVYLHGNGAEVGGTLANLKTDKGFAHLIEDEGKEFNSYILLPQTPSVGWNINEVMKIINYEVEKNGIDTKRISIWGFSMGANAVPRFVNANPNFFSSAVILSTEIGSGERNSYAPSFATTPTYILYGADDPYSGGSKPLYDLLISKGYNAKLKIYPSPQSHGGLPGKALTDTNLDDNYSTIMDWVLNQRRTD